MPKQIGTSHLSTLFLVLLSLITLFFSVTSQSSPTSQQKYLATTTQDESVDLTELEFALMPLTKAELAVEVDAWLTLLKGKAKIVSEAEILVSQKQKTILAAAEISSISAESVELMKQSK